MGQTFSSHARSEGSSRRVPRLSELTAQREQNRAGAQQDREEGEQSLLGTENVSTSRVQSRFSSMATFRREISAHPIPTRTSNVSEGINSNNGDIVLEQEERPLVSMEDVRFPNAPISDITASPMPRRTSLMRLRSRLSNRFSAIEPLDGGRGSTDIVIEQSLTGEGQVNTGTTSTPRSLRSTVPSLFRPQDNTRRRLAPISRPIPISPDLERYDMIGNTLREAPTPESSQSVDAPQRRTSRLMRVRRSIAGPIESVFGNQRSRGREDQEQINMRQRDRAGEPTPDETEYLLPPIDVADSSITLEEAAANLRSSNDNMPSGVALPLVPEEGERPRSWTQRWTDRSPNSRRESRGLNLLRGRSSRLIRRDDEAPLSRILQLAAAAIAAQLSGSTDALANLESVGDDHFDGGLNNFVEELNSVTGPGNESGSDNATSVSTTPLNFWRVFRFVSPTDDHSARAPESDNADPRTVTLVVVGVRSVPSSSIPRETGESGLDTLLGGPTGRTAHHGLLRSGLSRARLGRRSSIAGSTPFPQQYDSQRHQRTRPLSSITSGGPDPFTLSPPELTNNSPRHSRSLSDPSHAGSSSSLSNNYTPSLDNDMPSQGDDNSTGGLDSQRSRSRSPGPIRDSLSETTVRQRRRSASETARHRNLGSGSSRRNGTIDPDGGPVQGRSWLIYVVGTNLPEDHPAFTTPSLFTDNPSYEDMLLLSNILGPAKPPVASTEDVAASGGRFRIVLQDSDGTLRAQGIDDESQLTILGAETCQVCLEVYRPEQMVRKLTKCTHMFHQECVDEWLTTGRNSCPLCRGQGVKETPSQARI